MTEKSKVALILDLGGVIVDHDNNVMFDAVSALLAAHPSRAALAEDIRASGIGNGGRDAAALFDLLRGKYGSDASLADFLKAWSCHFTLKPEMADFVRAWRAHSPLVLCSNTNAAHWDHICAHYSIDKMVSAAVLSHEIRCEKPQPEIYLAAARAHGKKPEQCLFADDTPAYVEGARKLGFKAHHFQGRAGLEAMLAAG